jgi:hypothetical protein
VPLSFRWRTPKVERQPASGGVEYGWGSGKRMWPRGKQWVSDWRRPAARLRPSGSAKVRHRLPPRPGQVHRRPAYRRQAFRPVWQDRRPEPPPRGEGRRDDSVPGVMNGVVPAARWTTGASCPAPSSDRSPGGRALTASSRVHRSTRPRPMRVSEAAQRTGSLPGVPTGSTGRRDGHGPQPTGGNRCGRAQVGLRFTTMHFHHSRRLCKTRRAHWSARRNASPSGDRLHRAA